MGYVLYFKYQVFKKSAILLHYIQLHNTLMK